MKRVFAFVVTTIFLSTCLSIAASAAMIPKEAFYQTEHTFVLDEIQKNTYKNDLGQTMIQYSNIDRFVDENTTTQSSREASLEIAKKIIVAVEGTDVLNDLPDEYLMEALTYKEATQTISYVKACADGTLQYMSEDAIFEEIGGKIQNSGLSGSVSSMNVSDSWEDDTISDDGYMKLVITAVLVENPSSSVDERDHYYLVSAASYWLIEPTYTYEDVLALCFGSAIYDDTYTDFARIYELELCRKCSNFYEFCYDETYSKDGQSYNDPEGKNHLQIIYPSGAGIACRVNFDKDLGSCEHYESMAGCNVDYSYISMMFSYVRSRVLTKDHFTIHCAYGHKWLGIGSISVSIAPGAGKGAGSIGFSTEWKLTTYLGRPVTILYTN